MSFHLSPVNTNEDFIERTQRIYIDPQYLISLKNKRKTFEMVPSKYEPPEQDIAFKQGHWQKSTQYTLKHSKNRVNVNNSSPKDLNNSFQQKFPQEKLKALQQILEGQSIAPNVQFIWKLLPSSYKKQIISFQQGDCVPFSLTNNQKYLIISGQVRIIGANSHSFKRKQGYLLFTSDQVKNKIKQIVVLRSTRLLKITFQIYETLLKNYLYFKNSQKIKFIHYCPFFIWKDQLSEDLAACMDMKSTEKEEVIYRANSNPDAIYFVKEGIVLLERNVCVNNPVVSDYELHYEKNQISQKDTILVVRKGMAFGIDGIIIKEFTHSHLANHFHQLTKSQFKQKAQLDKYNQQSDKQAQNPQKSIRTSYQRKSTRIYTAKTLGKCELYCLDRKVLETLFSVSDINDQLFNKRKQISSEELERMSIQYTNMIMKNSNPILLQIPIKNKEIVLKVENTLTHKSKSLVSISSNSMNIQNNNTKVKRIVNQYAKNKRFSSQQIFKQDQNSLCLNEQREKAELRKRAQSQRNKEKISFIKKMKPNQNQDKRNNQNAYILPQIVKISKPSLTQSLQEKKTKSKIKMGEIINAKIKQDIKSYPSKQSVISKNIQKIKMQGKQSELVKFLEQHNSKINPAFINIKSYKSIILNFQNKH